jgi:hypothetical protein
MIQEGWVVICDWDKYQHYKDRNPVWIRFYTELLADDEYRRLPLGTRSLLCGLWLAFASSHGQLRLDTRSLSQRLAQRVTMAQLERLNDAGWIEVSASKPLAIGYQPDSKKILSRAPAPSQEVEVEVETAAAERREDTVPAAAITELLKSIGWNHGQQLAGSEEPERARAWVLKAQAVAQRNPGGYAWSGYDGGEWPSDTTPTQNGKPTKPLIEVLTNFIRGPGKEYNNEAILDEIGIHERKRNELLTDTQKTQLLELANQLRNGME